MQDQKTRKRTETVAVIGLMILFALVAVMAAIAIDGQARL
jgi:Tfp pilus assembly protein FimT